MSDKRKRKFLSFIRKLVIGLLFTGLFALLSIFPNLGYFGEASTSVKAKDPTGFWLVSANCNVTYNPFLYSFSWLLRSGSFSGLTFTFVSYPTYGGGPTPSPLWRTPKELEEEAILGLILDQVFLNLPFNFILLLVIEFGKLRELYICLFGGIIGFPFGGMVGFPVGGVIGAVTGFSVGILVIVFLLPKLKKNTTLIKLWDSLWETGEIQA